MNLPPATAGTAPPSGGRTFLGHPAGLFLLFLVEMWERFSYYGMRGLLLLYLIAVFSAKELPSGAYTNTLEITETQKNGEQDDKDKKEFKPAHTIPIAIAVGQAEPTVANSEEVGQPKLKITRLLPRRDSSDAKKITWEPAPEATANPIALTGPAGGPFVSAPLQFRSPLEPEQNDSAFAISDKIGFRISNPTSETIACAVSIRRDDAEAHTYFTVNDSSGEVSMDLRPDSARKDDDKPFDVFLALNNFQSGRNWPKPAGNTLYGWYTGLAYLLPIFGGIIADRLIGTHRSMVVGAVLISMGHVILGLSGLGELATNAAGMSLFVLGLAVIVLGTGYFKPNVSVMVGQLYPLDDPRRAGAFTIFYMGINLGAFICAFICGTLGQTVGWHYGFGSAAVGMLLGLTLYLIGRPRWLVGIGETTIPAATRSAILLFGGSLCLAALFALVFHSGALSLLGRALGFLKGNPALGWSVVTLLLSAAAAAIAWFISINAPADRGPVITIFVFIFFNGLFWLAFEQAGSSFNTFTEENTDRAISLPVWLIEFCRSADWLTSGLCMFLGGAGTIGSIVAVARLNRQQRYKAATAAVLAALISLAVLAIGILAPLGQLRWLADFKEIPATWFQSVNAGLIFIFAPLLAGMWTGLGRRGLEPSQSIKIALALFFLGLGYVFMVLAGRITVGNVAKASMFYVLMTYFWHTLGELCLSPTGLSFVTKVAPAKFVSLLMGIWFVSNFVANLAGGLIAGQVEAIAKGEIKLPWSGWQGLEGHAVFFLMFVISSFGAGLFVLLLSPVLKRLLAGRG